MSENKRPRLEFNAKRYKMSIPDKTVFKLDLPSKTLLLFDDDNNEKEVSTIELVPLDLLLVLILRGLECPTDFKPDFKKFLTGALERL